VPTAVGWASVPPRAEFQGVLYRKKITAGRAFARFMARERYIEGTLNADIVPQYHPTAEIVTPPPRMSGKAVADIVRRSRPHQHRETVKL